MNEHKKIIQIDDTVPERKVVRGKRVILQLITILLLASARGFAREVIDKKIINRVGILF